MQLSPPLMRTHEACAIGAMTTPFKLLLFVTGTFLLLAKPGNATRIDLKINLGGESVNGFAAEKEILDIGDDVPKTRFHGEIKGNGNDLNVFKTQRFAREEDLVLNIPVPDGVYTVTLLFAETWNGAFAAGKRVFDVYMGSKPNGVVKVCEQLDPFRSGGAATPVRRKFHGIATQGGLTIALRPIKQNPQIAGVVIDGYSYSSALLEDLPTIPAGPAERPDFSMLSNIGPRTPPDVTLLYDPSLNPKFKTPTTGAFATSPTLGSSNFASTNPAASLYGARQVSIPSNLAHPSSSAMKMSSFGYSDTNSGQSSSIGTQQPSNHAPMSAYSTSAASPDPPFNSNGGMSGSHAAFGGSSMQSANTPPVTSIPGLQGTLGLTSHSLPSALHVRPSVGYRRRLTSYPQDYRQGDADIVARLESLNSRIAHEQMAMNSMRTAQQPNSEMYAAQQHDNSVQASQGGLGMQPTTSAGDPTRPASVYLESADPTHAARQELQAATATGSLQHQPASYANPGGYSAPVRDAAQRVYQAQSETMQKASQFTWPSTEGFGNGVSRERPRFGKYDGGVESYGQASPLFVPGNDPDAFGATPNEGYQSTQHETQDPFQLRGVGQQPVQVDASSQNFQANIGPGSTKEEYQSSFTDHALADSTAKEDRKAVDFNTLERSSATRPLSSQNFQAPYVSRLAHAPSLAIGNIEGRTTPEETAASEPNQNDYNRPARGGHSTFGQSARPAFEEGASRGTAQGTSTTYNAPNTPGQTPISNNLQNPSASLGQSAPASFGHSSQPLIGYTPSDRFGQQAPETNGQTASSIFDTPGQGAAHSSGQNDPPALSPSARYQDKSIHLRSREGISGGDQSISTHQRGMPNIPGIPVLSDIPGLEASDGGHEGEARAPETPGIHNGNGVLDGICVDNSTHCSCGMADPTQRQPEECLFVVNEEVSPMICVKRPCSGKLVCACATGANSLCERSFVKNILVPASVHKHGVTEEPNVLFCRREHIEQGVGVLTPII